MTDQSAGPSEARPVTGFRKMSRIFSSHGQQEHLEGGGSGCGGGGGGVQTGEWMTVVAPALLYLTAVLHFDPRADVGYINLQTDVIISGRSR